MANAQLALFILSAADGEHYQPFPVSHIRPRALEEPRRPLSLTMMSFIALCIAFVFSLLPYASAHGFVSAIGIDGQWYSGSAPGQNQGTSRIRPSYHQVIGLMQYLQGRAPSAWLRTMDLSRVPPTRISCVASALRMPSLSFLPTPVASFLSSGLVAVGAAPETTYVFFFD